MPQSQASNLAVTKGGTVIHNVATIVLSGSGVTLQVDPTNPRNANVTITGGGGAQEWQAGTVTNLGTNLSLTSGTLDATGGSNTAGLGIDPTQLADGTIANTGTIHQPAVTGGGYGVDISFKAGDVTNPGTAGYGGGLVEIYGGAASGAPGDNIFSGLVTVSTGLATDGHKQAVASYLFLVGGGIYPDGELFGGGLSFKGGRFANEASTDIAAYVAMTGGLAVIGTAGAASLLGGTALGTSGVGGNVTVGPGSGSAANGVLLMPNIAAGDPHTLGVMFILDTLTGAAAISQG